jgi:Fe-S-cluster-containing dehydrogenase component/CRP-like cAMP-binding protein
MSALVHPALIAPLLDGPLLRHLDGAARAQLSGSARAAELAPGAEAYRDGDDSDEVFLVAAGAIELHAVRRGDQAASVLRVARAGDSFGEEALLAGLRRRATARALEPSRVVAVPSRVFQRLTARGDGRAVERERRYLERAAARDLLAASALGRDLGGDDAEILLDGMRLERTERGAPIYEAGDRPDRGYILVDGLVQIQGEQGGRARVVAYLGRGDLFGDEEALAGRPRAAAAVAAGDSWCAAVPASVLRTLADRNPGLMPRLRRLAERERAEQGELVGAAAARSTRHVFRDLYRMQMARSLLVIDQDRCVRCGHCAWSCAQVHGTSRLVRRGDKVVTRLEGGGAGPVSLLLPNTCQHCRHAACMIDCPTGAIGRDPEGEVFIRPDLCTGCGKCAKFCPWDNIQMAARGPAAPGLSVDVAVKCDLCRGYQAPACVESCPTEALTRLDPTRDIAEVAHLLGARALAPPSLAPSSIAPTSIAPTSIAPSGLAPSSLAPSGLAPMGAPRTTRPGMSAIAPAVAGPGSPGAGAGPDPAAPGPAATWAQRPPSAMPRQAEPSPARPVDSAGAWLSAAGSAALVLGALGWAQHERGAWIPGHGAGLAAGLAAAMLFAGLAGYAAPKRLVRRWMRRRPRSAARRAAETLEHRPPPRSRMRPHLVAHLALGLLAPAAAVAHAGARVPASPAGALVLALLAATLLGAAGALAYRAIPARLTRLERRGALPEDLAGEREALLARLYRETTGQSELVKAVADRLLLPYARAPLGWIGLVASGRSLGGEEARLRCRIAAALAGRGDGRLAGLDPIVRTAVELRALSARRALTAALRAWLPLHIAAAAVSLALLAVHVATALGR